MIASIENIYNRLKTKIIYPKTKYQAVFDDNGNRLDTDIAGIKDNLNKHQTRTLYINNGAFAAETSATIPNTENYDLFEIIFYINSVSSSTRRSIIITKTTANEASWISILKADLTVGYFRPIEFLSNGKITFQCSDNIMIYKVIGIK